FTTVNGKTLKLFRSGVLSGAGRPGEVLKSDGMLVIACGRDAVEIGELQLEGRKVLKSAEFLRGFPLEKGMIIGQ
ncbi:MAG TPA: methionyl-tRNA formyltransferase, partial [Bacteroidetes bacterium]|nr:methionyl-tRNA formyltransferase [Bacteroidota bacterium]